MKLPLNDDGAIDWKETELRAWIAHDLDTAVDWLKAIEQHTIERCAVVVEQALLDGCAEFQERVADEIRKLGEE